GNNYSLAITGQAVFGNAAADTVTGLTTLLVSGTTAINTHTVSSSGTQTYSGNVTIGASAGTASLSTTDSGVLFGGTTTLFSHLTVSAGTGPITFIAVDGGFALLANSSGTTTFGGAVGASTALASLTTDAGGMTAINGGSIQTTGFQAYHDAVTLGANATLTSTGAGNITFASTVDGGFSLTVNTAGTTTFGGAVGASAALASLTTDAGG